MASHEIVTNNTKTIEYATTSAEYLAKQVPAILQRPKLGVICGSGLGNLANAVSSELRHEIPYSMVPHFPSSSVPGHIGKLVFGVLQANRSPIVLMVGRTHYYEGYSFEQITLPIRVLSLLGVNTLIVTNAAGGLNPDYSVGDIVLLNDHLNLAGLVGNHPLRGPNLEDFGVRFPALSDAYDLDLRRRVHGLWKRADRCSKTRRLDEGTYAFVGGPSYETRAECRMLRSLGADLVGMSTVPEVIVARHCSMRILGLSLVTNNAVQGPVWRGDDANVMDMTQGELARAIADGKASHEEVLKAGEEAALDLQTLIHELMMTIINEENGPVIKE